MRVLSLLALCLALYLPGLWALPPVDRDEARFAQTSRQMLASGDFVRPRFQTADRFKKPIGIYWLQAAAVSAVGVGQQPSIWAYRLPSIAGALIAVLLTYAAGCRLFDPATGLLAAALLASSLLLVVEAHLATTDAALLACIVTAQTCLAALLQPRYRVATPPSGRNPQGSEVPPTADRRPPTADCRETTAPPGSYAALFWAALGFGILLKGPVAPLVSGLTWAAVALMERRVEWRVLRPSWGIPLLLAIVAPWALAVGVATNWSFFTEAWRGDLLPKLIGGHESHWGPPGYYLLLSPLTFWPGSLVAGLGVVHAWNRRSEVAMRFCLAWLVPSWVAFELIPTKLPHYVLPLYPPLALLAARAVYAAAPRWRLVQAATIGWCALTVGLALLIVIGPLALDGFRFVPFVAATVAGLTAVAVFRCSQRRALLRATQFGIIGAAFTFALLLQWVLPGIDSLWPSRRVAQAVGEIDATRPGSGHLASAGYDEPSLVFLLGSSLELGDGAAAAELLDRHADALAVVSESEHTGFTQRASALGIGVTEVWSGEGLNYSKGRRVRLGVFARKK